MSYFNFPAKFVLDGRGTSRPDKTVWRWEGREGEGETRSVNKINFPIRNVIIII